MQSWAYSYATLAEMAEASDLVTRTTVLVVQDWESPEGGIPWTEYPVRIDQPVRPSTGAPTALTYLPESSLEEHPDDATDLLARVAALG